MYKVIKYFTDMHDKNHPYNVGDEFPREGIKVTAERLKELSGSDNKQGVPLIELSEKGDSTIDSPAASKKKVVKQTDELPSSKN